MQPPIRDGRPGHASWATIANALPGVVFSLTPDGRVNFVNERWFVQTGIATDEMLDDAWFGVLHPDDRAGAVAHWRTALAAGAPVEDYVRFRMHDGSYRYFHCSARPVRDESGDIQGWYGLATDVHEHRLAQASVAEAGRRLQTVLESIPQIVWTADGTGWIDWYNPRWYEFTGQTPAEAAGWGWQGAHHPEDLPHVMQAWPRSIATGEPFEMEFRLRRYDGEYHWFLTRIVPVRDRDGHVVRWYGSNTDIEEQKRSAQRSAHIAQTLQEAFLPESLPHRPNVRFDAVYVPAESEALVGGDWYDAIDLPDGRIVISCGDVSGHGVSASVSVGRLRQAILFAALDRAEPAQILTRVNRVSRFQEATIATCVVAVLDPSDLSFTYALAGHPPPIVALEAGAAKLLPYADAPPLGVVDDFVALEHRIGLVPDAVIALYSDGVTEFARDIDLAEARLVDAVGRLVGDVRDARPALAITRAVMADARSPDDIALLVVQCSAVAAAAPAAPTPALIKVWRFHSSDARTARASRIELMSFLEPLARPDADLYGAELVLGEILANLVEHAPGLVEISIDWTGTFPRLTAVDNGPGMTARTVLRPPDPLSEEGRGLFLIHALARDVTVDSTGSGTRLSATLPMEKR